MAFETKKMMSEAEDESERVLFLPYNPHDADRAREIFSAAGVQLCPLDDLTELINEAERGVGCILVAEEKLDSPAFERLVPYLEEQPSWSDLPLIVVTREERSSDSAKHLARVANATLVERPVRIKTLVSMARAALRDRRRQYDIRRSIANRDQFLAMLGHELRNPLAAIILGLEQLAHEDINSPALDIIRRQSGNLERIVDDLLAMSRISRGVISFDKERLDVTDLVSDTVAAYKGIAREQGLELTMDVLDEPLWVYGDSVRLEQVLGNLLSNAVRYTPEGGQIEVGAERDEDTIVIAVCDTGMGIPAEMLEKIFALFTQAHDEFSRREGGLGLGLSLAHTIIENHDGEITVESGGEGEGSQFFIRLPADDAPQQDD